MLPERLLRSLLELRVPLVVVARQPTVQTVGLVARQPSARWFLHSVVGVAAEERHPGRIATADRVEATGLSGQSVGQPRPLEEEKPLWLWLGKAEQVRGLLNQPETSDCLPNGEEGQAERRLPTDSSLLSVAKVSMVVEVAELAVV